MTVFPAIPIRFRAVIAIVFSYWLIAREWCILIGWGVNIGLTSEKLRRIKSAAL